MSMNIKVTNNLNLNDFKPLTDLGNHLILDFHGVEVNLNDFLFLDKNLREILSFTSVTIENMTYKKFIPQGVTILYLLSESHFSIHTWPENKSCAIDFYHCGNKSLDNLRIAEEKLCNFFGWENCNSTLLLNRGKKSSYLTNNFEDKSEILHNIKFLYREKTLYQEIRIYDTLLLGRILVLDGSIQISTKTIENDNYTKDLCQFINLNQIYNNIIIIGGGDLIIVNYLLKNYLNIKKIILCEIDERVIEITKKYFEIENNINKEIKNGRLEIIIESGFKYINNLILKGFNNFLDGIIIDCTDFALDENSLSAELYTIEFYNNINKLLKNECFFSQQITKLFYKEEFRKRINKSGFEKIEFIISQTPEYGGELPIAICQK